MSRHAIRIGIVATGTRLEPENADKVTALARALYADRVELFFHPQCFNSAGHFAGTDEERASAFVEIANDERFAALWFARGGYGAGRLAAPVLPRLGGAARRKAYLGYSDAGALLGALYKAGFEKLAHGPMPVDITREGGSAAIERALRFLVEGDAQALEPTILPATRTAAFNITILSHLIGTPWQPDLSGHVLMLEDIGEYMYRIDRALLHITSNADIRKLAAIRLGRVNPVPANNPDFGASEEEVVRHWCAVSGIAYQGRADIGHDIDNKIVPFGLWRGDAMR